MAYMKTLYRSLKKNYDSRSIISSQSNIMYVESSAGLACPKQPAGLL